MYSVKDLSVIFKKSERTIYRLFRGMPSECIVKKIGDNGKPVKCLNETGFIYLTDYFCQKDTICRKSTSNDKMCQNSTQSVTNCTQNVTSAEEDSQNVISLCEKEFLLQQLVEKDKQIEYLQQHIQELTELNKNFQVLLQNQQVLFLPNKKKSLFDFFHRRK